MVGEKKGVVQNIFQHPWQREPFYTHSLGHGPSLDGPVHYFAQVFSKNAVQLNSFAVSSVTPLLPSFLAPTVSSRVSSPWLDNQNVTVNFSNVWK